MPITTTPLSVLAARGLQTLFGTVVLGVSITLIRGHKEGALPASLAFAAITGAVSIVAALLSLAASVFDAVHEQLIAILDGVVFVVNAAGGILLTVRLKGVSCRFGEIDGDDVLVVISNPIICGGITGSGFDGCYYARHREGDIMQRRCREATADSAFMFLTALTMLVAGALAYLRMKKGR